MCKGYAILINDKEIVCGETNSHSQLKQSMDGYLKVNVIYDDEKKEGYRIEPDCDGSSDLKNQWIEKTWLNAKGEICAKFTKRIHSELAKPETRAKMFKVMCCNLQNATIEGYQFNHSATIKGDQDNGSATIKGDQSNNSATIEGYQSNDSATIKGDIIIYNMHNGSKETQKLLDEFTKLYDNDWRKCTFDNFVKWLVKTKSNEVNNLFFSLD